MPVPKGKEPTDLQKLLGWLFGSIKERTIRLSGADSEEELSDGEISEGLEKCRMERLRLLKMERLEKQRMLVPMDEVKAVYGLVAARLRRFGELLKRRGGHEYQEMLNEVLNDCDREITRGFGDDSDPD